jgi:hypothetical protein
MNECLRVNIAGYREVWSRLYSLAPASASRRLTGHDQVTGSDSVYPTGLAEAVDAQPALLLAQT